MKTETSCQHENWSAECVCPHWLIGFLPRTRAATYSVGLDKSPTGFYYAPVFCVLSSPTKTVGLSSSLARILLFFFFITRSIFGISQLFLRLNLLENSNEKNAYRPSILGLTVLPGRPFFICFGNCISLNAFLSEFQLLRLVTSLAVLLLTSGL